jgi:hypothetical protein
MGRLPPHPAAAASAAAAASSTGAAFTGAAASATAAGGAGTAGGGSAMEGSSIGNAITIRILSLYLRAGAMGNGCALHLEDDLEVACKAK